MSFAKQFGVKASRRAWIYGCGLAAFGGLITAYNLNREASRDASAIQRHSQELVNFKPYEIEGKEAVEFPWHPGKTEDWEYKLVKVRGFFSNQRVYVKRQRDGKDGYLVFAPFYTYHQNPHPHNPLIIEDKFHELDGAAGGLMVNLGWLPAEHKKDIDFKETNIEPIDLSDKFTGNRYVDPITGFNYVKEYNPDRMEKEFKFVEVEGVLRRGESWNPIAGNVNMPKVGSFNFIDLDLMYRLNLFANREASRAMYLERVVPSLDLESNTTYPIPSTKENYIHGSPDAARTRSLAGKASLASVVSLVLMAPALLL